MIRRSLLIPLVMLAVGCSGQVTSKVSFNRTEPLRVVVLPFVQVDAQGTIISSDGSLAIDQIPLLSSELMGTPAEFAQDIVERELAYTALDIVPPAVVSAELVHHGFAKEDLSLDLEKVYNASPRELCTHLLTCDAVLYGKVTRWDRSYLAIQSISRFGADIELRSMNDGRVLFQASIDESDSRGITKGPTGFSDLVIAPLKGLDSGLLRELALRSIKQALRPLRLDGMQPDQKSPAPAIIAAAHSNMVGDGVPLSIAAVGTPRMEASFAVEGVVQGIPMVEGRDGQYYGELFSRAPQSLLGRTVVVSLRDQSGRLTQRRIALPIGKG